jgi:hypothetical protein
MIAIAATADRRFDLFIFMARRPAVEREAIVGTTTPLAVLFDRKTECSGVSVFWFARLSSHLQAVPGRRHLLQLDP